MSQREEDVVTELFITSTHDFILFFTDRGKVYKLKGYEIPESGRAARGTNIINLLPIEPGDKVTAAIRMQQREDNKYLCMVTKNGVIKRTELDDFENIRKTGIIALSLDDDDELRFVRLTSGDDELIIATRSGRTLRFDENDARCMGRTARGVRAIKLAEDGEDAVVGMAAVREGETLLTVSEAGMGRRTPFEDYPQRMRGGKGVLNYNTEKLGPVAGVKSVSETDDVVLISDDGVVIRIPSGDVSQQSRYAGGVRVMRLAEGTRLVTLAAVAENDEEELSEAEAPEGEEVSAAEATEE